MISRREDMIRKILIASAGFFLVLISWNNNSIWADEAFTLNLTQMNFRDAMAAAVSDAVHPPLYYYLLMGFQRITMAVPVSVIVRSKLFSAIWIILALAQGSRMIQQKYGSRKAILFLSLAMGMQVIRYGVEIRMYSLAMYTTLIAALYADRIEDSDSRKNWGMLTLYSVLSCYSHYFSILVLIPIWLMLLYEEVKKKNLKTWLIGAAAVVICFLPWLSAVSGSLSSVPEDRYPITIGRILHALVYPYSVHNKLVTAFVCIITVSLALISFFRKDEKKIPRVLILNPLFLLGMGILLSVLVGKFFDGKYLLPGWIAFLAGISISAPEKCAAKRALTAALVVLNAISYVCIYQYEEEDRKGYQELMRLEKEKLSYPEGARELGYYGIQNESASCTYRLSFSEDTEGTYLETIQIGGMSYQVYQCR